MFVKYLSVEFEIFTVESDACRADDEALATLRIGIDCTVPAISIITAAMDTQS